MPQSYSALYVHAVFATKQRRPLLRDRAFREEVHAYLAGIAKGLGCPALAVGGIENHVHIILSMHRSVAVSDCIRELKKASNSWARDHQGAPREFGWQAGFGAFSVDRMGLAAAIAYASRKRSIIGSFPSRRNF